MCTNKRWVRNPHSHQYYYVNCGHCDACLQEKANKRVTRINNEWLSHSGLICLFFELDYNNETIPYIKKSEVDRFLIDSQHSSFNIYRNGYILQTLSVADFVERGKLPDLSQFSLRKDFITSYYPYFHFLKDKVSVLYKKDIQNFFKRLKINLFRSGYDGYFSYFYASDYGGKYKRSHFHALVYIRQTDYKRVVNIICKSWKFSDLSQPRRQKDGSYRERIEVARNPANYVASYVNRREDVSSLLSLSKPFKPMYHFSNGFGCNYSEFSFDTILEKVRKGTLYYVAKRFVNGVSTECNVLTPKYVLLRYFPKFKGFMSLSSDEIFNIALEPSRITHYAGKCGLTKSDELDIYVKLCALRRRCLVNRKLSILHDWAFAYSRVWPLYYALLLSESWKDVRFVRDVFEHFDNIGEYLCGRRRSELLDSYNVEFSRKMYNPDPKTFNRTLVTNMYLIKEFRKQKHHHEVKNLYYE